MDTAVLTVHFVLAFLVIGVILLQGPKGEGLGAIGGSARMFHGPRPRETLFTRITAVVSVLFAAAAVVLPPISLPPPVRRSRSSQTMTGNRQASGGTIFLDWSIASTASC